MRLKKHAIKSKPKCCYIYILPLAGQKLKIPCPRNATWEIHYIAEPYDPYDVTEVCDRHVGFMLDFQKENRAFYHGKKWD
jgi:hypothetical protein